MVDMDEVFALMDAGFNVEIRSNGVIAILSEKEVATLIAQGDE